MKAAYDTSKNWETVMEIANDQNFDAEDMLRALTDWHGLQLLDYNFTENLMEEYGYLEDEEE